MKVINFFGAPGVGKTRSSMMLAAMLKEKRVDAEVSLEVVKEYIFSGNENMLSYQNYIFASQDRQLRILQGSGEVEYAVTDAPLLNSVVFQPKNYPIAFKELVFEVFASYDNINFLIKRTHEYSHQGRLQDEESSDILARRFQLFLNNHGIPFIQINSTDSMEEVLSYVLAEERRVSGYIRKERK